MGTMESLKFLVSSPYIRDLATLVVAYGISINLVLMVSLFSLLQFPSPNEYSLFVSYIQFDRDQFGALALVFDSSDRSKEKSLDQKTLRRLAQNREASRKSRLRKKAYVQQLESSRLKLTQLEQEGGLTSTAGDNSHATGALAVDVEYARWMEEQNKQINELRAAVIGSCSYLLPIERQE